MFKDIFDNIFLGCNGFLVDKLDLSILFEQPVALEDSIDLAGLCVVKGFGRINVKVVLMVDAVVVIDLREDELNESIGDWGEVVFG